MEREGPDSTWLPDGTSSVPPEPSSASVSITPIPIEGYDDVDDAVPDPVDESDGSDGVRYDSAGLPIIDESHIIPTVPDPSPFVARYLFDSERYCGEWRRHWIHVAKWLAIAVLSPFAVGYVVGLVGDGGGSVVSIVLVVWLGLLMFIGFKLVDWYYDRFVLTNKRVMVVGGLVNRRVGMMPLARVTDMAYTQSVLGRMLNYGTFVLESAGQDQALREIKPLPHPDELYLLFCQEMYEPGRNPSKPKSDMGKG